MLRLMGFLFGSAVALVALLTFTDLPALAPYRQPVVESVSMLLEGLEKAPAPGDPSVASPPLAPTTTHQVVKPPARPSLPVPAVELTGTAPRQAPPNAAALPGPPSPPPEPRWHVFWNHFRSEFSANGFAERLAQATGLDFRVLRVGSGRYEVAFAYLNERERQSRLDRIAAATGLQMVERGP